MTSRNDKKVWVRTRYGVGCVPAKDRDNVRSEEGPEGWIEGNRLGSTTEVKRDCPGCSRPVEIPRLTCPSCGEGIYRTLVTQDKGTSLDLTPYRRPRHEKSSPIPEMKPEEKLKPFRYRHELAQALKRGRLAQFMEKWRIGERKLEELTGIGAGQWRIWRTEGEKVRDSQIQEILSALDAP